MGRWPIAGLCMTVACSASEAPSFLDFGALARDLAVVATLDEDDELIETRVVDGADPSTAKLLISLPSGARLVGVAFDRASLEARSPRLATDRLSELTVAGVQSDAAVCPEGVLRPAEARAQVSWPEGARAFEWSSDEERRVDRDLNSDWWARVRPEVPLRADRCLAHPELSLEPFSPKQPILDASSQMGGAPIDLRTDTLTEFVRLDERWLLATQGRYLFLAEHGVGFVDQPGRALAVDPGWRARSVAVGRPNPDTGLRRLALMSISGSLEDPETDSRLDEVWLDGDRLSFGATLLDTEEIIDGAHVRPEDDRLVVYQAPDRIFLEREDLGTFDEVARLPNAQVDGMKRGRLLPSGIEAQPLALVGSRPNTVYLGSADGRAWSVVQEGLALGLTIRAFVASDPADGEVVLYAGNTAGQVFERKLSESRWTTLSPRLDPALIETECATTENENACGFARPRHSWQHFTVFKDERGQRALLSFADFCSLIFIIRPDGCTSSLRVEALGPLIRPAEDEIFAARSEAGFVTLSTERGQVYEISWAALGLTP